ncbi:hypothetical protein SAMN04490244_107196 [Tranquillimonas rosea]|uniref:Uncharacterized protein n=1 Tax=Tranquillimonas rosea TaxID=641238 RepID=A0A1H9VM58_9RHOB|nr:hypothetical protein SAMN04490244_107196 [Tranquillimonas rosea]
MRNWFSGNNDNHSHSGLKQRWLRDFISAQTETT